MTKRESIIQAAIEVVAKNGIADSPTIQIAKAAGAAEFTIFRLFGNKNDLLHEVFDEVIARFHAVCWPEADKVDSIDEKLRASLITGSKYYRKNPEELAYIQQYIFSSLGVHRRPDIRYEKGEDVSGFPFISILAKGREEGIFKELSMTGLAALSVTPMISFLREEQIRHIKHSKREMELFIEACLQGVRV
jgi:AcrR family transcriptional regulator